MKFNNIKYMLIVILLSLGVSKMFAQTATNSHSVSKPSVVFDLSEIDVNINKGNPAKGFVLPVVEIDNLLDIEKPIKNPAEGLLVYNNSEKKIKGVYMFKNGMWSAIVNRGSSIENAVARVKDSDLEFKVGEFKTVELSDLIFNNTYGDVEIENSSLKLLPGNYLVTLNLSGELNTTDVGFLGDEYADKGKEVKQNVKAHLINFESNVFIKDVPLNNSSFLDVLVPMTDMKGEETKRKFSAIFYYGFMMKEEGTVNIQLGIKEGTTYSEGEIKITDTYVNIEKSIL